jgi:hypothetical protein
VGVRKDKRNPRGNQLKVSISKPEERKLEKEIIFV